MLAIRVIPTPPISKLYLINGDEAFHGWYAITKHKVRFEGQTLAVTDLMGRDTDLLHFTRDPLDQTSTQFVAEAQTFFDNQWNLISVPLS